MDCQELFLALVWTLRSPRPRSDPSDRLRAFAPVFSFMLSRAFLPDSGAAMAKRVTLSLRHESPVAYSLDFQGRPLVRFEDSGQRARLSSIEPGTFKHFDILRWGAPFALAPQGVISLHASCVTKHGLAIAFLGSGGAGKSTLARRLRDRHWERLADDMMMVDDSAQVNACCEEVVHRWCDDQAGRREVNYRELAERIQEPNHQRWLALRALLFLDKARGQEFRLRSLPSGDCFHRLVKYGFSSLPTPEAWEHQFRIYGGLASRLQAGVLQCPNGLEPLTSQLPHLENCISQWLSDSEVTIS
jgi:hypothetical protein